MRGEFPDRPRIEPRRFRLAVGGSLEPARPQNQTDAAEDKRKPTKDQTDDKQSAC